jgi:hypothetical protein
MTFTAHVHPKAPQDDKVYIYGVKSGGNCGSGGTGVVNGGGAAIYHSRSWRKIDKSRLQGVSGKFISLCVFFSAHAWPSE